MTGTLHLELLNQVGELEKLAKALAEFGKAHGLHHRTLYAANLAAEELAINLLAYAWDDGQDHVFSMDFSLHDAGTHRELHLALSDDGLAFNPFEAEDLSPPELSDDQLENLCLGIRLVRMVADVCHYERRDGHNLVRLRFQDVPDRAAIASSLAERRVFPPPREFAAKARIGSLEAYQALYRHSVADPEGFWAERAEELSWFRKWEKVLEQDFANGEHQWFLGGQLNAAYNCLDRHLATGRKNKAALIWEGETGSESRTLTYQQLHREVCRFGNVLKRHGVHKGDRITLYLPMIPELAIAVLACARIGAVHCVVFGGFSDLSLRDRLQDSESSLLICADGYRRSGKLIRSKETVDKALQGLDRVGCVLVVRRTGEDVPLTPGRDFLWDAELNAPGISDVCAAEAMDAEDPLFILYTSGSTGKPKGVLHTQAGYLLYAQQTFQWVFDIREEDTYWCTADIGWVTGHSYILYGPLANGATSLMFEGVPTYPKPDRFWEIVEKYRVNIFYTAPTALRALMKEGDEWPARHDLGSLRLLGTVGEPINPEAWMWYHQVIGKGRCPIVDTWWQTETGGILIAPLPGAVPTKPGAAGLPMPGVQFKIIQEDMGDTAVNEGGWLVMTHPWPGLMRRVYGDPDRFRKTYFSQFPGVYTTGDSARVDQDGYVWLMGRIDDVINVSGHRLGTAEIESALVAHPAVAEAAVVGIPHEIKGQGIHAFVTLKTAVGKSASLVAELRQRVREEIGPIAIPDALCFADTLPKTRSGKIMRRILGRIASGETTNLGDTSTLTEPGVIEELLREKIYR
ncbi:MAG: acetate--CoA ligase [Chromatiaceae bacterium]